MSTNQRLRGHALQRAREQLRMENPLCLMCLAKGRVRPWTQRDHVIALDNGGADTDANTQGLCDECHETKTAQDMGYKPHVTVGIDGYPV